MLARDDADGMLELVLADDAVGVAVQQLHHIGVGGSLAVLQVLGHHDELVGGHAAVLVEVEVRRVHGVHVEVSVAGKEAGHERHIGAAGDEEGAVHDVGQEHGLAQHEGHQHHHTHAAPQRPRRRRTAAEQVSKGVSEQIRLFRQPTGEDSSGRCLLVQRS
eukprot:scaffold449_cov241-Pinguiococcus_pyrenoidosus.AAC.22